MGIRMDVPLRNLIVWHDNPRAAIEMSESEDEAIDILFEVEGKSKMLALATDVAEFGLNSHRQPIVVRNEDMNSYIVFDGNRRISVLKLLAKGDKRVEGIENHINVSLDTKVFVYVTNRDEALRLIEIEHSGEQGGKGQIDWDAYQRDYALNNMNKVPAYPRALRVSQICNLFHKKDFKKIPYTDLETIFNNVALKRIFKISADWDFEDEATIRNVYSKLIENKPPKKPYSRYLVKLNELGSEYEKFKMKVLDNEALENPVGVTPSVGAPPSAGVTPSVGEPPQAGVTPSVGAPPSAGVTPSVGATLSAGVAPTAGGNNSYKTKPIELLNYAKNNIKIDSYVFKTYLDFVVQSKFSSIHPYKIVVPFLYRVLLESAIQHWIDWFRKPENQSKFRSGSDGLIGGVNVSNLLNTPRETSVVNEKKLNEIKEILKVIKDNHACSFIRECFRGIPSSRPTSFINDINSVVHGSIVEIDIEKLKTYDDYVLMYLKAMSYSMNL